MKKYFANFFTSSWVGANQTLLWVLLTVSVWRFGLFVWGAVAPLLLSYKPEFPYAYSLLPLYNLPQWIYSWANFDGVHYLTIVAKGYLGTALIQAFFPLYPILVRMLDVFFNNAIVAGITISFTASIIFVLLLSSLTNTLYGKATAQRAILLYLLFPTSFFLGAVYNESLFLVFVVGGFLAAHHKRWWLAGCCAAFASATRVVGVFMVPALLIELLRVTYPTVWGDVLKRLQLRNWQTAVQLVAHTLTDLLRHHWRAVFACMFGMLGLLVYMIYLTRAFADPLYFAHVQSEFGSGREERLVLLPQVIWRGMKIIATAPHTWRFWTYSQELIMTIGSLSVLLLGFKKRNNIPIGWLVFSFLALLLPTTTGVLSSMPRYVLVAFPIFIILAQLRLTKLQWGVVYIVSLCALLLNVMLFIQGYWIA